MMPPFPRKPNLLTGERRYQTVNGSGVLYDGWILRTNGSLYTSVKTPGWKAMSRQQQRAVKNPYVNAWDVCEYNPAIMHFRQYSGGPVVGMQGYFLQAVPPVSVQNASTSAQSIALGKLQKRVSRMTVNLAQAYAERKQAASMLNRRVHQVLMLARAVKRGHFGEAARDLREWIGATPRGAGSRKKEFANNWLEFQYGWRPLLSDIYGSCELIARTYHERRPTTYTAKAMQERPLRDTTFVSAYELTQPLVWNGTVRETYRYSVDFVEDDLLAEALANTGISNPALLAWEVVPYSFVVDWFIPVGNYLEQLTYANGLRFVRGTVSRRAEWGAVGALVPTKPSGSLELVNVGGHVNWYKWWYERQVLTSAPYQGLPTFSPNLGVTKALNGISLITQIFAGRRK